MPQLQERLRRVTDPEQTPELSFESIASNNDQCSRLYGMSREGLSEYKNRYQTVDHKPEYQVKRPNRKRLLMPLKQSYLNLHHESKQPESMTKPQTPLSRYMEEPRDVYADRSVERTIIQRTEPQSPKAYFSLSAERPNLSREHRDSQVGYQLK